MTEKKMFSLDFIDESIRRLNIQPCDGDRPSCLRGVSLQSQDSNLHQHGWQCMFMYICSPSHHLSSAMQMWTLGRFLPLLVGHLVEDDDDHWLNFLCLLDIMDILFARPVTADACALAEVLISDHHSSFMQLYPHLSITLKMHSMIHMPRLMQE